MSKVYKKRIPHFEDLFRDSFRELSMLMSSKLEFEKSANNTNLDSGIPLEDYFRVEFSKFIPNKYSVDSATIVDKDSYTCGDCDFIIYDDQKSVFIKRPSTKNSRRKFLFHEATYGIIEVKQKLTLGKRRSNKTNKSPHFQSGTLHKALEKLFSYKQLNREFHVNEHVIAVKPGTDGGIHLSNKPFSYAFFYDSDIDINNKAQMKELMREFYWLNMKQPPEERVNGIFVLNKFVLTWQQEKNHFFAYHPPKIDNPTVSIGVTKVDTLYFLYILLANVLRISEVTVPIFNRDYGGKKYLNIENPITYSGE